MAGVALRPLSVGEIIDASFQIYRRHFGALATIVLVCNSLPLLLQIFLEAAGGAREHPVMMLGYYILYVIMSSIATAAAVFVVSESYLGRAITAREALNRATPFVGRVIMASILFGFLAVVGFILLVVPGVIIVCGLVLTPPALVIEGLPSATAALGRSWNLTRGFRLKLLGLLFLLGVIMVLPWLAVSMLMGVIAAMAAMGGAGRSPMLFVVLGVALGGLVQFFLYPLSHAALTVAYYDLRVRKEGFDLELLASTLQTA
ncbi:MAG: hypothetical protein ACM3NS_11900 [Deltaproteobacteria bacterium]